MRLHNILYRRGSCCRARSRFYHCQDDDDGLLSLLRGVCWKNKYKRGLGSLEHEQGHHMKDEGRWSGKTRCPSVVKTETLVLMYLFKK